jgi:hypothetical protein
VSAGTPQWPSLIFMGLALAAGALLLWTTRGATFMQDEWDFIQGRSYGTADAFLQPHNNHLLALPVVIYKGLWSTFGLDDYWVWRLVAVGLHLISVGLLYEFARRRVGSVVAVAACVPILVLGSAWEVLLIPFNMAWYLSTAALLGILLLAERHSRAVDAFIAALVLIALASSSLGPPVALGVMVACLMSRQWRRLVLTAVPVVLYALWFVFYNIGAENQPPTELTASPAYLLHTAAGSVGALLGLPLGVRTVADREWLGVSVHLVTAGLFAALVFQLATRRRALTPTLALIMSVLAAYWLALTLTRGYTGYAYVSRYLYVSCVLLALLAVEYFRGHPIDGRRTAAILGVAAVAAGLNLAVLRHYSAERRYDAMLVTAELGALEISRQQVDPLFRPDDDPKRAPNVVALTYFAATDRIGSSPAPDPEELARMPEAARQHADGVLIRAFGIEVKPYTRAVRRLLGAVGRERVPLAAAGIAAGSASSRGDCLAVTPDSANPVVVELRLPSTGLVLTGPGAREAKVSLRRFGSGFGQQQPGKPAGASESFVAAPLGKSSRPWHMRIQAARPLKIC